MNTRPTLSQLLKDTKTLTVSGLRGGSPAFFAAEVAKLQPCCLIVPDEHLVEILGQDLRLFSSHEILVYPAHEIPPYTPLSPDQRTAAARLSVLYRLKKSAPSVFITSAEALVRRIMPMTALMNAAEYLLQGEDCDQNLLQTRLQYLGYEKVALVQAVGDYSVRGGIVDLYPPPYTQTDGSLNDGPIRLDFFGDTIESIRAFDPFTQRSTGELVEATLLPVTDVLLEPASSIAHKRVADHFHECADKFDWSSKETARIAERMLTGQRYAGIEFFLPLYFEKNQQPSSAVLEYIPSNSLLLFLDPDGIEQSLNLTYERIYKNHEIALEKHAPALSPNHLFVEKHELDLQFAKFKKVCITDFAAPDEQVISIVTNDHQLLKQEVALKRTKFGILTPLKEQISLWQSNGDKVILCCRSSRHMKNLADLLGKHEYQLAFLSPPLNLIDLAHQSDDAFVYLTNHPLSQGFSSLEHRVHILSENELFGEMRLGSKSQKKPKEEPVLFTELNEGDIVVHRDHGLGIYKGLETISFHAITKDFACIEYRDGDKLLLPVDRLNLLTRYQGLSDREPKIDKLGSQNWKVTKNKVKEEVWKVAQDLLQIYAKRELRQGNQFSTPGQLYHELEESFPFDETQGQAQSITDVIADLISEKPMDRLVCGDVGYGKTEVAVRAAFKVVEDGYQVAVLVPTTVLAEQHLKTFSDRLQGFPVSIACLNRFRSNSEQRKILRELAAGNLDIIIGTHRILSKDVVFKNLGLVVIDEEHRFGVAHKERLKKLRAEVDILTLTATPIPRTLQMSLLTIRDLSVISTPPIHRLPVKTFVARYDELVIKEAISKELRRGGQVFFVHNRVRSIYQMSAMVQKLVPEAKIAVAHGQMAGKDLENIMVSFVTKQINVLVSTTIIESGLDIPSANTIIINRADMLGLAEIYQLRGRVGRSSIQSYAYLLVPSLDGLNKDSKERLQALLDCSDLGGGFKLAMNDLQIRGGGNLLGVSQSGNIAAIGYDLYLELLQKTVMDLKTQTDHPQPKDIEELDPEINLQLSAYIPQKYIPDIKQRYIIYRRLAASTNSSQTSLDELRDELVDRYGPLPEEASTLFQVIALKNELTQLRITKLEQGKDNLVFSFRSDTPVAPEKLITYVEKNSRQKGKNSPKLAPDGRLIIYAKTMSTAEVFRCIANIINELEKLTTTDRH